MLIPKETKGVSLTGSAFENSETETISENILFIQRKMNLEQWSPFTWEDYKKNCTHQTTESELTVLGPKSHFVLVTRDKITC